MKIQRLTITNLRALEQVELEFDKQMSLVVGINGVGKSTVLDALRICASRILPSITQSQAKAISFSVDDIRSGFPFLDVDVSFDHNGQNYAYTRRQWRETAAKDDKENIDALRRKILDADRLRDRKRSMLRELDDSQGHADSDIFWPSKNELRKSVGASNVAPNCVFFSARRSVVSDAGTTKSKAVGGVEAAYAEALSDVRPLYLAQFADWMRVQAELAVERPLSARHMEVLRTVVGRFLPELENLRPDSDKPGLLVEKSGVTLNVRQLSDGERGVLALVLDLARRLSQANPTLDDPLQEGEAIVLVDEIDLHLHPKWQWQIVNKLTSAFPNCQFIATTHSPQVVAGVETDQVLLLTANGVEPPDRTLGMDANWILRHLMGTDDRPADALMAIESAERLIKNGDFAEARATIQDAKTKGFDLPEWSVLEARMARLEVLGK